MKFRTRYLGGPRHGENSTHTGSDTPPEDITVYHDSGDAPVVYKLMDNQPDLDGVYNYFGGLIL